MINYCATKIYTIAGLGTTCSYNSIISKLIDETKQENYFIKPTRSVNNTPRSTIDKRLAAATRGTKSEGMVREQFELENNVVVHKPKKEYFVVYGDFSVSGRVDGLFIKDEKSYIAEIKTRTTQARPMNMAEKIQMLTYCHLIGTPSVCYIQYDGSLHSKFYEDFAIKNYRLWEEVLLRLDSVTEFINLAKYDEEYRKSIYQNGVFNREEIARLIFWV